MAPFPVPHGNGLTGRGPSAIRWRRRLGRFRWTLTGLAFGGLLWLAALAFDLDWFEQMIRLHRIAEPLELDELLLAGMAVLTGAVADRLARVRARRHERMIQEQRIRVMRATMRTVQDVAGNFLNNLNFFLLEAEEEGRVHPESILEMRALARETAARLEELAELQATPERELVGGVTVLDLEAARRASSSEVAAASGH